MITEENALLYCTKRSVVSRGIDNFKKAPRRSHHQTSARCGCAAGGHGRPPAATPHPPSKLK